MSRVFKVEPVFSSLPLSTAISLLLSQMCPTACHKLRNLRSQLPTTPKMPAPTPINKDFERRTSQNTNKLGLRRLQYYVYSLRYSTVVTFKITDRSRLSSEEKDYTNEENKKTNMLRHNLFLLAATVLLCIYLLMLEILYISLGAKYIYR